MIDIGSKVIVVNGSKRPNKIQPGITGTVFWKKRYDSYGAFGILRIGIKSDDGNIYFIDANKTKEMEQYNER